jgi:hypothetical protein
MVPGEGVRFGHRSNGANGSNGSGAGAPTGLLGPLTPGLGGGGGEPPPIATGPGASGPSPFAGHYRTGVQRVVLGALWLALGLGVAGGVVSLLGLSDRGAEPVAANPEDQVVDMSALPAPVTETAELAVAEWLTATEEDGERIAELFIEAVTLPPADEGGEVEVGSVRAVAGHLIQEGYWVVTVRAQVVESIEGAAQPPTPWYVEVGIVGDVAEGVAALSTPGVVPAPPVSFEGWESSRPTLEPPDEDDPLAGTVEGFLRTLLAGQGDPEPYLAPGAVIPAASPPPFADLVVSAMAVEEQEGGDMHVWVDVVATSPAGREQPVSYEMVASPRADGWEIAALWGAPSLGSAPDS